MCSLRAHTGAIGCIVLNKVARILWLDEWSLQTHCTYSASLVLQLESLKDSLRVVERAVTQNYFQPKQALYRDFPVLHSEGDKQTNYQGCIWCRC